MGQPNKQVINDIKIKEEVDQISNASDAEKRAKLVGNQIANELKEFKDCVSGADITSIAPRKHPEKMKELEAKFQADASYID